MRLELATFQVDRITLGPGTRYSNGELRVDPEEVRGLIVDGVYFSDVRLHLAHPGESVRIIHVLDVMEPRHKVSGPGCVFPGILGPPVQVGEGRTHRLGGMAVVSVGGAVVGEAYHWREAIIDMSGPGAPYSPFSRTANLVVEFIPGEPGPDVPAEDLEMLNSLRGSKYSQDWNVAVRRAQCKLVDYLAQAVGDLTPSREEVYQLGPVDTGLPKVMYAAEVLGEFLYGAQPGWQPTLLHPNELMDGALFRPFNTPAAIRYTTYFFQNHPVVDQMYRRHGKDLEFMGVLLYPCGNDRLEEKERNTSYASKLLQMLGAQGVVITWIGGGHPGMDPMLLFRKCEALGIKATLLNPEMARTPDDTGFVFFVPEADAIVSTGNYEKEVSLPSVDRVIGGDSLLVSGLDASRDITVGIIQILGSTHTFGAAKLTGVQY